MEVHIPVLLNEVLEALNPKPGEIYIDATINGGGHAKAIAAWVGPQGKIIGIDWDCEIISNLKSQISNLGIKNLNLVCDNYANIANIIQRHNVSAPHGILFDLGFSFYHLEKAGRGFSFQKNEPLDMRYSPVSAVPTAADIIRTGSRAELEKTLREYGEERYARKIAEAIAKERKRSPIETTFELIAVVRRAMPRSYERGRIHPATRTFQALRIAVNGEFENIAKGVCGGFAALRPHGKIAVITFHSGEDRIIKNLFRDFIKSGKAVLVNKKPIIGTQEEIARNPRARSAKLRVIQKISAT